MNYFMVNIYGEDNGGWNCRYQVYARDAYAAVEKALMKANRLERQTLHGVHVGPGYEPKITEEVMKTWPEEDWFENLEA